MRNTYSGTSIKNRKLFQQMVFISAFLLFTFQSSIAQKPHISVKDSLDGAFDLSDYIIYAHGFIVVPTVITEPALGGIGGALVPVFLKKHAPVIDQNGKKRFINLKFSLINKNRSSAIALFKASIS